MSSSYPTFPGNSSFFNVEEVMRLNEAFSRVATTDVPSWQLAETAMFGAFSLLFLLSLYVIGRKKSHHVPDILMLLAVIVLYTGATLDWVLGVLDLVDTAAIASPLTDYMQSCMYSYDPGQLCERSDAIMNLATDIIAGEYDQVGIPRSYCISTVVLAINISISDSIVLWRAWVLWKENRAFSVISLVLLLGSVAMSGLATGHACLSWNLSNFFQDDAAGLAAYTLSLVTNLWATSLIGFRAWQHRRLIREHLHGSGDRTLAEKVLALIAESGVLYCAIWIFLVADEAVGIYPTIIMVLVALEKSYLDRNLTCDMPLPTLQFHQHLTSGLDAQTENNCQVQTPDQPSVHNQNGEIEMEDFSYIENSEGKETDIGLENFV
ncbi:hypothetical protein OF83DRAFT_1171014 [Amylostereum chailletii]|nr:hypothetical protein OF83DRAFT_1171014 [Amylostereum chailletii]